MSEMVKFGAIIYAKDMQALSEFYLKMFDLSVLHKTDKLVSIGGGGFNVVVHAPPEEIPERKFNAVKLYIAVESLNTAKSKAEGLGGKALKGEWSNSIFKVCNIADPEGNHIQLREFLQ
ncbi:VOC family protein [Microbulbifer sp. JMSA004]|uniref:VOC family protein n=1 Tax=Microbulbifer sp. JMSA004 TaxID=3243370 RepID=UPI004039164B